MPINVVNERNPLGCCLRECCCCSSCCCCCCNESMQQLRVRLRNSSAARRQLLPRIAIIIIAVVVAAVVGQIVWLLNGWSRKIRTEFQQQRVDWPQGQNYATKSLKETVKKNVNNETFELLLLHYYNNISLLLLLLLLPCQKRAKSKEATTKAWERFWSRFRFRFHGGTRRVEWLRRVCLAPWKSWSIKWADILINICTYEYIYYIPHA